MMKRVAVFCVLALSSSQAFAGAPFLNEDPVPVDHGRSEFYVFSTFDGTTDGSDANLPAFEYSYGVLPEIQLTIGVPFARAAPDGGPTEWGLGDVAIVVKYRLVDETDTSPQIAVAPTVFLPAGDSHKGLGNGKTWWRLPVCLQKSWGEWTTYGGGGYVINPADGETSHAFGGWLLQKDLDEKWMLGGEIFARGKDTVGGRATTLLNFGGAFRFSPDFRLLFSAGHSISGETHATAYLGLWWGFGGDEDGRQSGTASSRNLGWLMQR
jgi:hypothetical protein